MIEADALLADRNFRHVGPHFCVEAIAVHPEIARGIVEAEDLWQQPLEGWFQHRGVCRGAGFLSGGRASLGRV
jgi:hypothetical protein